MSLHNLIPIMPDAGFEPTNPLREADFESAAFVHLANLALSLSQSNISIATMPSPISSTINPMTAIGMHTSWNIPNITPPTTIRSAT